MASLKHTVQSLIAAKKNVTRLESEFLRQLGRVAAVNGGGLAPKTQLRRRRVLKCSHCSRRFALPLHLGRHMSVAHRPKPRRAARAAR